MDQRGAVFSIDTIGCQKGRPWPHRSSRPRHDYVLTLKDNHSTLHEEVALWLDEQDCQGALCWPWKRSTRPWRLEVRCYSLRAAILGTGWSHGPNCKG